MELFVIEDEYFIHEVKTNPYVAESAFQGFGLPIVIQSFTTIISKECLLTAPVMVLLFLLLFNNSSTPRYNL